MANEDLKVITKAKQLAKHTYVPMVGEKGTVMATYSTDEKAEKAMKMLHDAYHDAKKSNSSSALYFSKDDEV